MIVKSVRVLDNSPELQLFPIEISYIENGKEFTRLTSAKEVLSLFKEIIELKQQVLDLDRECQTGEFQNAKIQG